MKMLLLIAGIFLVLVSFVAWAIPDPETCPNTVDMSKHELDLLPPECEAHAIVVVLSFFLFLGVGLGLVVFSFEKRNGD